MGGSFIDSVLIEERCIEERGGAGIENCWEGFWRLRFIIVFPGKKYEGKGLISSFLATATAMLQTPTFPLSALAANLAPNVSSPGNGDS